MTRIRVAGLAILAGAVAVFALAQNADKNSAGPTRNDYRLGVVQPLEGAEVVGPIVQVIVNTEIPGDTDVRRDVNSMPRPDVQVYLDDAVAGRMRDENNVVQLENVTPGPHTIVLLALNRANEVIDRKVIHIIALAPPARPAPAAKRPVPPPPARVEAPPPAPEPPAPAPAPEVQMPKTATNDALLVLAGLALLAGGFALRRFA
ncbi:MAG TPA: LPXTG cell wall anchor domain-containing protein [Thermoanaerobaculia bacterium]|nr:LPXTG cell wall anchor domain-containing protein [Thermoanaerobaculia bacterium]